MAINKNTFKKEERLCSEKLINKLFNNGSSFLFYPFRVVWLPNQDEPQEFPVQLVISVSKKRFRKSVDRNLLKRRVREAFRTHKGELLYPFLREHNIQLLMAINYVGKEILDFQYLESKMIAMFKALEKHIKG